MANYATLKAAISQVIKENGNKEITGAVMQTTLLAMVDSMASGYTFAGVATPSTSAGTPDENVFWIGGAGSYNNFGATTINVPTGCICIFTYNGSFASSILYVGGVVDISKLTNTSYASLSQALADVPSFLQVGGLEVMYQDSTSSNYVKYRLMTTSWSTTVNDWQGVDEVPIIGSNNVVESGGIASSILNSSSVIKAIDNKQTTVPISYFENPCEESELYTIKNIGNVTCSFAFFNSSKQTIGSSLQLAVGIEKEVTCPANAAYIGGWADSLVWSVEIRKIDTKLRENLDNLTNNKSDKEPIQSGFVYQNGYIHSNASSGVQPSDALQYSSPIYVTKGTKIYLTYVGNGSFTALSKTDKNGSSYVSLAPSNTAINIDGHKFIEYVATEDMYICICGYKEEFFANIDTNHAYLPKSEFHTFIRKTVNGDFSFPFTLKQGRKYLIKNEGETAASVVTRITATGTNIYRIDAEEMQDRITPTSMLAGSFAVITAPIDTNYIIGYSGASTTISIKDITSIEAIEEEYGRGITSRCPNLILQSREGRVSSTRYPNNTKWGIKDAARNQYDRIRFTVRKTTDGYFFLCHDDTINAIARNMDGSIISSPVTSYGKTLAELNAYDWGIKYGEKYAGMNVPLLTDALYYANLFNLAVTLELNYEPTTDDYETLFNLCSKYGLVNNLTLVPYKPALFDYFKTRNKKVNYWWGGTYSEFTAIKEDLKNYLTGENNVFIYNTPYTDYPSDEYLNDICANGFTPHFSNVFNISAFIQTVKKGMVLIDVANVPFVKSTLRSYADNLIE